MSGSVLVFANSKIALSIKQATINQPVTDELVVADTELRGFPDLIDSRAWQHVLLAEHRKGLPFA